MDYIQLLQKRLERVNDNNLTSDIFDEFFRLEKKIVELQQNQIDQHQGFDDKVLNRFSKKPSRYSVYTQDYADENIPYPSLTKKPAGQKYNFVWGGDFMSNFRIKRQNKGLQIYSTGTGSGAKKDFFEDYKNMFGLNSENTYTIESEVFYYVLEKTFLKIFL